MWTLTPRQFFSPLAGTALLWRQAWTHTTGVSIEVIMWAGSHLTITLHDAAGEVVQSARPDYRSVTHALAVAWRWDGAPAEPLIDAAIDALETANATA